MEYKQYDGPVLQWKITPNTPRKTGFPNTEFECNIIGLADWVHLIVDFYEYIHILQKSVTRLS